MRFCQAKEAAKAKTLRAKFEHWEKQENNVNTGGGNINAPLLDSEQDSIESTKSLRARFESLKAEAEQPKEKARPKVNRFVVSTQTPTSDPHPPPTHTSHSPSHLLGLKVDAYFGQFWRESQ